MECILLEIVRLEIERDAFVAEANGRVVLYNHLIKRWKAMLQTEPDLIITQGEEESLCASS